MLVTKNIQWYFNKNLFWALLGSCSGNGKAITIPCFFFSSSGATHRAFSSSIYLLYCFTLTFEIWWVFIIWHFYIYTHAHTHIYVHIFCVDVIYSILLYILYRMTFSGMVHRAGKCVISEKFLIAFSFLLVHYNH